MRAMVLTLLSIVLVAPRAQAQTVDLSVSFLEPLRPHATPWRLDFRADSAEPMGIGLAAHPVRWLLRQAMDFQQATQDNPAQPLHTAAIEHSDAYQKRAKIHKYASFATLPLFAAELALGQSIYDTPTNVGAKRNAHIIVGTGIIGLFGVNTVIGAWNLFGEGWTDKEGRTLRVMHGLLMMASDAGFLATWATGPNSHSLRGASTFEASKVMHRNLAIVSIGSGTVGYLLMLFGNR
jgi:hypothetical protein